MWSLNLTLESNCVLQKVHLKITWYWDISLCFICMALAYQQSSTDHANGAGTSWPRINILYGRSTLKYIEFCPDLTSLDLTKWRTIWWIMRMNHQTRPLLSQACQACQRCYDRGSSLLEEGDGVTRWLVAGNALMMLLFSVVPPDYHSLITPLNKY